MADVDIIVPDEAEGNNFVELVKREGTWRFCLEGAAHADQTLSGDTEEALHRLTCEHHRRGIAGHGVA